MKMVKFSTRPVHHIVHVLVKNKK